MLGLHQVVLQVSLSHLSSRQVAEVHTNMDEVAVFLKFIVKPTEPEPALEVVNEEVQEKPHEPEKQEHKGFIARLFGKMRHGRRRA